MVLVGLYIDSKKFLFSIFLCYAILGLCAPVVSCIWPEIAKEISVDASLIGIVVTLNCFASGISSFIAFKVRQKLGTNYTNVLGLPAPQVYNALRSFGYHFSVENILQ